MCSAASAAGLTMCSDGCAASHVGGPALLFGHPDPDHPASARIVPRVLAGAVEVAEDVVGATGRVDVGAARSNGCVG